MPLFCEARFDIVTGDASQDWRFEPIVEAFSWQRVRNHGREEESCGWHQEGGGQEGRRDQEGRGEDGSPQEGGREEGRSQEGRQEGGHGRPEAVIQPGRAAPEDRRERRGRLPEREEGRAAVDRR